MKEKYSFAMQPFMPGKPVVTLSEGENYEFPSFPARQHRL
jgi:hypothetical protein